MWSLRWQDWQFWSFTCPGMFLQQPTASAVQKHPLGKKKAGAMEPTMSSKLTASKFFTLDFQYNSRVITSSRLYFFCQGKTYVPCVPWSKPWAGMLSRNCSGSQLQRGEASLILSKNILSTIIYLWIQVMIKVHPQRVMNDRKSFNFDIGLIKLDRKVFFGPDLSPICLKVLSKKIQ